MKRISLSFIGLLALLLPVSAWAQFGSITPAGLLSNTTLNGAITSTATTLVLTSATKATNSSFGDPAAGQCLYIDREMMTIVSMSSTTATVRRGTRNRSTHADLAIILTGPCSTGLGGFMQADPPNIGGNQDCTLYVLPWVNITTGDSWWCDLQKPTATVTAATWSVTNTVARNSTPGGSRRVAQ